MSSSAVNKLRVLFVDDEAPIRDVMRLELPRMGHEATICEDGQAALNALEKNSYDAAIVDLRMPGLSGWDVIDQIKRISPETEIVISTGHGSLDEAIQAIRRGAYDFLPKPCKLAIIGGVLQRIAEKKALENKAIALEGRLRAVEGTTNLVGTTAVMERVKKLIERIAPTDSNVLILGETGTGKELVARRVHELSRRLQMPFVAVNCGALPENLVESELFGHRKGAFTGADTPRKGLIEVANGGTLFLDELGELDKSMQVKLLRVLESGEVRRLGENESFHVDIRVICATNRSLLEMVEQGSFREDLYFRVNTFEIHIPPLRERKDDIPDLAQTLIARHLKRPTMPRGMLSPEVLELLRNHDWTGNVRELANALEHAVIMSDGKLVAADDLDLPDRDADALPVNLKAAREAADRRAIRRALAETEGNISGAAKLLGISRPTLYDLMKQYQLQP